MKGLIHKYLVLSLVLSVALADVGEILAEKSLKSSKVSDKAGDAKPKRDASFLVSSGYHGPSFKYLPPGSSSSSVYDSYGGAHHGLVGSYSSSGHLSGGHHHVHHGGSSGHHSLHSGHSAHSGHSGHSLHSGLSGLKFSGISHGSSLPALSGGHSHISSVGHHGYGSSSPLGGHHHLHSSRHGHGHGHTHSLSSSGHGSLGPIYSAGHGILSGGPSYVSSHGSGSSGHSQGSSSGLLHGSHGGHSYITSASLGSGHKVVASHSNVPSYSLDAGHVGTGAGLAAGYHYTKGLSGAGSLHSADSSHLGSSSGIGSFASHGLAAGGLSGLSSNELHSDHVHNGNQEHHYVLTPVHDNAAGPQLGSDGYRYETPSVTYLAPSNHQQHHVVQPSNSYGVPLAPSYVNSQDSGDESPIYAAGHKGLGHFSFTANKPNVLHTSFIDSAFKAPNYSSAPFKPSTFLGTKYEGSSYSGDISQQSPSVQYLPPPSGVSADSSGYDYPIPTVASLHYRDAGYQSAGDNATPIHEPESTYLPPNNLEASYNEVSQQPSANYLPPSSGQSYGAKH